MAGIHKYVEASCEVQSRGTVDTVFLVSIVEGALSACPADHDHQARAGQKSSAAPGRLVIETLRD